MTLRWMVCSTVELDCISTDDVSTLGSSLSIAYRLASQHFSLARQDVTELRRAAADAGSAGPRGKSCVQAKLDEFTAADTSRVRGFEE